MTIHITPSENRKMISMQFKREKTRRTHILTIILGGALYYKKKRKERKSEETISMQHIQT